MRDVLLLSGEPNDTVHKVWNTKARSGFEKAGGSKRVRDLIDTFEVQPDGQWKVYPAKDPRVLQVLRKIIRGLSYKHKLRWPISDDEIWVDHRKYKIQDGFLVNFVNCSADPSVIQYGFTSIKEPETPGLETYWELNFLGARPFLLSFFRQSMREMSLHRQSNEQSQKRDGHRLSVFSYDALSWLVLTAPVSHRTAF